MNELRQRQPREECQAFLAFVRRRPCCVCLAPPPSQAAHIRMSCPERGKRSSGIGEKPSDQWCTPLCTSCHLDAPDAQHKGGERAFWTRVGVDPFETAARLWTQFCRTQDGQPKVRKSATTNVVQTKRKHKNQARGKNRGFGKPPSGYKHLWPKGRKIQNRKKHEGPSRNT